MDLYEMFPRSQYALPRLKMAALGGDLQGQVLIHEQDSNSLFLVDPTRKELQALNFKSIVDNTKEKLTRHFSVEKGKFLMRTEFSHESTVIVYQEDSNKMDVVDLIDGTTQQITMPFIIGQFHPFSRDMWLVCETGTDRKYLLTKPYPEAPVPCVLHPIESHNLIREENEQWKSISTRSLPPGALSSIVREEKRSRSNRLLVGSEDYATVAVAQPDQLLEKSPVSFYSFERQKQKGKQLDQSGMCVNNVKPRNSKVRRGGKSEIKLRLSLYLLTYPLTLSSHSERKEKLLDKLISEDTVPPICLPATAQVVRLVPDSTIPKNEDQSKEEDEDPRQFRAQRPLGYLEVTDVARK